MEAREVRALARLGIADPYRGRSLMATRHDDEGGSRLWRGMRALLFGDDGEPTLRDQIEEAIDEAEDERAESSATCRPTERQMLRNLLHFGDRTAGDVAVTRGDIIAVPSTISFDELVAAFAEAGTAACRSIGESLDEVIGMIHIKDVFKAPGRPDAATARIDGADARRRLFVPESMGVLDLLARMRAERDPPRHRRRRVRRHRGPGHDRGRGRGDRRRDRGRA